MENSLFNQPEVRVAGADSMYYVTNQLNLREIINGHFIGSIFSFDNKYYEDLLNIAPGYIPFLSVSMISEACQKVSVTKIVKQRPVILELDAEAIRNGDEKVYSHSDDPQNILCVAVTRPVPTSKIKAIHFISTEDLEETRLREWGEIIQPVDLYTMSPELLNIVGNSTGLYEWLSSLSSVKYPAEDDYGLFDRMAGAVALCSFKLGSKLARAEDLSLLMNSSGQKSVGLLPSWLAEGIHPNTFGSGRKAGDEERALFTAALSVLYRQNWETVNRVMEVTAEIERQIENMKLARETTQNIQKKLERMRGYLRNEFDFGPTPAKRGFEVSKALTLFLMRTDYDQLNRWPSVETGATEAVMITALVFAGAATGFKNINSHYRTEMTDQIISARMISAMFEAKKQKKTSGKSKAAKSSAEKTVTTDNYIRPDAVPNVREIFSAIDPESTKYNRLAGDLCRHMNWNDCVRTRIRISGVPLTIEVDTDNVMNMNVTGVPEIIYDIDAKIFGKYLSECNPDALVEFENLYFADRNLPT